MHFERSEDTTFETSVPTDVLPKRPNVSKVGSIRQPRPVVSPKKKTLTGTIDDLGEQIRRDIAPKPHFLRQLENFMESELVALGCQDSRPTAARLQVFQQCFQHFIDEFKTYRGFLYRIKNEYDSLVDRYADQLHYLAPLEMRLTTLEHEREQQLKQRDIRHNQVVQELKHSLTQTQARLGQYAASNALLVEEKTQVEDACKTASENYEQMLSTNKTLVAALKREEEGTARREKKENEYQHSYLSCKNALEKAQDEIERLKQQSIILQEAQAQMISIDVANERAATIKQMNKTISDLNHANQQLKDEKRKLVDTIQDITARRLDDATIAANVTNTSHLIPNEIITGTENECQQPVITDSLHDTIEQRGSAESSEVDQGFEPPGNYFVCKDDGPSYLRYDGLVRNIRLSKRTTERIIGDCWKQKEASEKSSNQTIALEDYFYRYLKVKFGSDANIAEWGNNVVSALETYAYDSDCRIFQAILQGEVAEGVRVEQLRMLYRVYEAMVSADKIENNGQTTGKLPLVDFMRQIRHIFPDKSEESVAKLNRALLLESKGSTVDYVVLLAEDRDGNQGKFCECLREQHFFEILEYTQRTGIKDTLLHECSSGSLDIGSIRDILPK